ncbi:ABC-2 type transport system permease protein [Clostridium amylolyticum]|uniref:ABC-2 type transport system permease protein n=1 Tax=Clostridium amylolyticum TaxID=1121298 RepID=A0A1M6PL05_9CLOT|nr:ABC transporter permease [Clostridium amylolyticum]SHK08620.1 ABC-2 type transport system permease protein [Clostridium amylolyticum]
MMNVVSSEFYKIFRSKIFYVISIILFTMNVIGSVTSVFEKKSASFSPEIKAQMSGIPSYQVSYGADIIFYIILIFVACLITAEYANGSIRQMACHGIARWKLVLGQYIAISSVITMILLSFGILNLLSGTILFQLGEVDAVAFIRMNVGMLCMFWGIAGIGTFFSYLFKNGGITIAISVLLIISGNFIVHLLTLLTKNDIFTRYSLANMRKTIIDFTSKPEDVVKCSIVFLLIGMAAILGSSLLFSKRDVD